MNMVIVGGRQLFLCDTYVNHDPTSEQLAELTLLAADEVRRFGLTPSVALLSHSSFGSANSPSAQKMRDALALIQGMAPDLAVEGEMHGDAALSKRVLDRVFPDSSLAGEANLLITPNLDAGNIAYNLLRVAAGGGVTVGPILLGAAKPAHILTQTATVRGILNMTALAVVDATQTGARATTRIAAE
jgi:malate dehydrogenase (oxaloacetate-decarboxylating)(NADP+)